MYTTIRLSTTRDGNGNPRRKYVTFQNGNVIAQYEEGYYGIAAIKNPEHRAAYSGVTIEVSMTQYRNIGQ